MSFLSRALRKAEVFLEQVDEQVVSASRVLGPDDGGNGDGQDNDYYAGDGGHSLLSGSASFDGDFPFAAVTASSSLPSGVGTAAAPGSGG